MRSPSCYREEDEGGPERKEKGQQRRRPSALRLAVLNFPHNPTGCTLPSASALERALALCLEEGKAQSVLSDEMYRGLHAGGDRCSRCGRAGDGDRGDGRCGLPTAAELAASSPAFTQEQRRRVISLGGLSKWAGAPGLRIGWLATKDRGLLNGISSLRDHTSICNSAPSESLALAALGKPETAERLRERAREIVDRNVAAARAFFESNSNFFEFCAPQAGSTCLPRLKEVQISVDDFCKRAREEAGVLLLPWTAFGSSDRGDSRQEGPQQPEGAASSGAGGRGRDDASSSLSSSPPDWIRGRFRLGLGRTNLPAALEALGELLEKMRGEKKR